ncbi:uncharacterized protein LOC102806900 [Saccoglossus kowalevskii]
MLRVPLCLLLCLQIVISDDCLEGCECYRTTVYCENLGLQEVPSGIPVTTTVLSLDKNYITILRNDSFVGLVNLEELYVQDNLLSLIEVGAFLDQAKLRYLYLAVNRLSHLKRSVFVPLSSIKTISLQNNYLTSLTAFSINSTVQDLLLDNNNISKLSNNCLEGLSQLTTLGVESNNMSSIEAAAFSGLNNLHRLYLHYNQLRLLPYSVFTPCFNLQEIGIRQNNLVMIPDLSALWNLTVLELQDNSISTIHLNTFSSQERLRTLKLDNNLLTSVPNLLMISNLRTLSLNKNRITDIHDEAFRNKEYFQDFKIEDNLLTKVPIAIKYLPLKDLSFVKNPIIRIEADAFAGLTNLENLWIHDMDLLHLHEDAFMAQKQNTHGLNLFLQGNDLQTLPGTIFEGLNLENLDLQDNPWSCDCGMCDYRIWMPPSPDDGDNKFDVICEQPDEHLGFYLSELKLEELVCQLPSITESYENIQVSQGASAVFNCTSIGLPQPFPFWLTPSGYNITMETENSKVELDKNGTLVLYDADFSDCGIYTCIVVNVAGHDTANTTLIVTEPTSAPTVVNTITVPPRNTLNTSDKTNRQTNLWTVPRTSTLCTVPTGPAITTSAATETHSTLLTAIQSSTTTTSPGTSASISATTKSAETGHPPPTSTTEATRHSTKESENITAPQTQTECSSLLPTETGTDPQPTNTTTNSTTLPTNDGNGNSIVVVVVICCSCAFITVTCCVIFVYFYHKRKQYDKQMATTNKSHTDITRHTVDPHEKTQTSHMGVHLNTFTGTPVANGLDLDTHIELKHSNSIDERIERHLANRNSSPEDEGVFV